MRKFRLQAFEGFVLELGFSFLVFCRTAVRMGKAIAILDPLVSALMVSTWRPAQKISSYA